MKVFYQGKLKRVEFTLAVGDLFDANVDAIVNSENSAFELALSPSTISGQLLHRYGPALQDELFSLTGGEVFGAGTVLTTSGGGDYERIYHAGFHDPASWHGRPGSLSEADYFEAIGACLNQVFDACRRDGTRSVAFPLIGCGSFGLNEKMLVLQFLDALERFDERLGEGEPLNVWLVIRETDQFFSIVGYLMDMLFRLRGQTVSVPVGATGIPLLDRFASRLGERSSEEWAKWQLCRLAEIALEFMCFGLCRAVAPPTTPESLFAQGMAATFGTTREHALKLAASLVSGNGMENTWGSRFFSQLLTTPSAARALEKLNTERNNLAHGRKSLAIEGIRGLMDQCLRIGEWGKIPEADGELCLADWSPWVMPSSPERPACGLFERWEKNARRYLVPETGEIFKVPHRSEPSTVARSSQNG